MSRYFYYLFLNCMFINTIFFVPRVLLKERFDGALMGMIISVIVGSAYTVLFIKSIGKFPEQGIPEIFKLYLPGWIRIPLLIFFGIMWAIAGSVILITFATITLRFLNPETSLTLLLLCFCGISCWAAAHRPQSILYVVEIVMCLNLPVVAYIMIKSVTSQWFDWDAVRILSDYIWKLPSWTAIGAATYSFSGYLNLALYNRMFKPAKIRALWLIPIIGLIVLFTSVIVPVGLLGIDNADEYIYTWISSADTLRMKYGIIERIVFLFLFIYISFSLSFITITWNIGAMLISQSFKKESWTVKKIRIPIRLIICVIFACLTFFFGLLSSDKLIIRFVTNWQLLRMAAETLLVAMLVWMAWRKGRKHA